MILDEIRKKRYSLRPGSPSDKWIVDLSDIEKVLGEMDCAKCGLSRACVIAKIVKVGNDYNYFCSQFEVKNE